MTRRRSMIFLALLMVSSACGPGVEEAKPTPQRDAGPGHGDAPHSDLSPRDDSASQSQDGQVNDVIAGSDMPSVKDDVIFNRDDASSDVSPLCVPQSKICNDLISYKQCNTSGTGYQAAVQCALGLRCQDGNCVNAKPVVAEIDLGLFAMHDPLLPWPSQLVYYGDPTVKFGFNGEIPSSSIPSIPVDTCMVLPLPDGTSKGTAFNAGPVEVQGYPGGNRTLTYDNGSYVYAPTLQMPGDFPFDQVLTFTGTGQNLVGSFSGQIKTPAAHRLVTQPEYGALLPSDQPLLVQWSSFTGTGTVRLRLRQTDLGNLIPDKIAINCVVADDGAFTIPVEYLDQFSNPQPSSWESMTLYLIEDNTMLFSADGLDYGVVNASTRNIHTFALSQ